MLATTSNTAEFTRDFEFFQNYSRHRAMASLVQGLVIIGLLVVGVLVGKSLIRSAEILSLIHDERKYVSDVNIFKLKYNYLPGDYPQAETIWGVMPGSCGASGNFSTCAGTTNGDGNGYIQGPEMILVWNQLALAGLISGKYAGTGVNGNYAALNFWSAVEDNLPTTAFSHVYPMIWYEGDPRQLGNHAQPTDYDGFYLSGYAGNVMVFGTPLSLDGANANAFNNWPSMYVADASTIDIKLDDGMPATGNVQALGWFSACTNTPNTPPLYYNNFAGYTYNFSNTSQAGCAIAFIDVFQ